MKKILSSFVILLLALCIIPCVNACSSPQDEPQKPGGSEVPETPGEIPAPDPDKPQPGVYTFKASALKGKWEAGDQIYVHGNYGPASQLFVLSGDAISADGTTASIALDESITKYLLPPDGLYAAWPGEAVRMGDDLLETTTDFSRTDILLTVAYLSGTEFNFVDASSAISFSVSGYDQYVLCGNDRPGLRFTGYSADYSSESKYFSNRKTDGYPFLKGEIGDEAITIWIPGSITIKKGITIFVGDGENWPMVYQTQEDLSLKPGTVLNLGDITSSLKPYDGPGPKVPEMVNRTKYTVKLNELSGLCLSEDEDFLWAVGDGGDLAKVSFTGEVIDEWHISGDTEAVSRHPETGDLLIGMEPGSVGIVKAPSFNKNQTLFKINDAKGYGNAGIEGLTYYKDNRVYAGAQTSSHLFLCDLETGEVVVNKRLREIFPSITEIADLCYDPLTDWLWIIDSEARKITALTGDASQIICAYSVMGIENPESLCVDHKHSCIWVGDDYGSTSYLYRFDFTGLDDAIIK